MNRILLFAVVIFITGVRILKVNAQEDVTDQFLTNANLSSLTGWTQSGYTDWRTDGALPVIEFWNWSNQFNFSQTVTLPAGNYRIAVNAFYRNSWSGDGTNNNMAWIFAGDQTQNVVALNSMSDLNGYAGGNDLYRAATAFSQGKFSNAFDFDLTTQTTIELGFRGTCPDGGWCILGPVKLFKYSLEDYLVEYRAKVNEAEALEEGDMFPSAWTALQAAIVDESTFSLVSDVTTALNTLTTALNAAYLSMNVKSLLGDKLTKMKELTESTNFYTEEAYEEYYGQWQAKYDAGTLTTEEASGLENPYKGTGWRDAVKVDNFLLSAWDAIPDFGSDYYINTWSTEGNDDGTEFKVPFFEYWTGDGNTLGAKTMTATATGLEPGAYEVSAWVRVRYKNGATEAPYGISMVVNDGDAVNVCTGNPVDGTQFYLGEFTAIGTVGDDGVLTFAFDVAADNNVSWLSFQNVKYALRGDVREVLAEQLAKLVADAQSKAEILEMPVPAKTTLSSTAAKYVGVVYTDMDEDGFRSAIAEMKAAIASAEALSLSYVNYTNISAFARGLKEQDVYTDYNHAGEALQTVVENADATVAATESADVIIGQVQNLINAAKTFISSVSIARGKCFDLTGLIQNPGMDAVDGWSYTFDDEVGAFNYLWYGVSFSNAEFFNTDFDIYQTLTDMPKGNYMLKVQAFQRPGSNDVAYQEYISGVDNINSYIYINDGQTKIKNVMSEHSVTVLLPQSTVGGSGLGDYVWPNGAGYTPNGMEGSRLYFDAGYYDNEVLTSIEAGDLRFGFRCTDHAPSAWTIFDNFRLYYYGSAIDVTMSEDISLQLLSDIDNANVTLELAVEAGEWNALVLPFDVTKEQLAMLCGDGVEVAALENSFEDVLIFAPTMILQANVPFLLKSPKAMTTWMFDGCPIMKNESPLQAVRTFNFVGNYTTGTKVAADNFVFADGVLTHPTEETTLKAFHAYIIPTGTVSNDLTFVTDGLDPKRVDEADWNVLRQVYTSNNGANWNRTWTMGSTPTSTRDLSGVKACDGKVVSIELASNNLSGVFPLTLFTLPSLETLDLSYNSLTGMVDDIESMSSVRSLNISNNKLTGNIGKFAQSCPNLTTLDASYNQLTDVVPIISSNVTSLNLNQQETGVTIEFDLANLSDETLMQTLPTIVAYNHDQQAYSPDMNVICTTGSLEDYILPTTNDFAFKFTYSDETMEITSVSKNITYRGENNDVLNAMTDKGYTFKMHLSYPQGDADFDGLFDVIDLYQTIDYIMGVYKDSPFNFVATNLYVDNIINVQDVICMVDALLEQPIGGSVHRRKLAADTTEADAQLFWRGNSLILKTTCPVAVVDLAVQGPTMVNWKFRDAGMKSKSIQDGRLHRVIAYSMNGTTLPVGETVIGSADVVGDIINITAGDGHAHRMKVIVSEPQEPTGIEEIQSDKVQKAIYDLTGRKVQKPKSGVYVIDGKKVLVK